MGEDILSVIVCGFIGILFFITMKYLFRKK